MKIVIIGSGWLGTPLAEYLQHTGHEVSVTYRNNKPQIDSKINTFSTSEWTTNFSTMLHQADCIIFAFPSPKTDTKTHSEICLEIAALANVTCRFLFASTTGIYPNDDLDYSEKTDLSKTTNKHLETERELTDELKDRVTIIRLAGLVGENRFPVKSMSASGKTYNGNEKVNLLHLKDAVGIFAYVIEKGIQVPVLNACSPIHPEKGEYYSWMAEKLGIDPPLFEKGPTGKTIQSDLSISLGYVYYYPDPFDFL